MTTKQNPLAWIAGAMFAVILLCLVPSIALGVYLLAQNPLTQVAPTPTIIHVMTPLVRPTKGTVEIPQDQVTCEAKGGKWGRIGLAPRPQCNLPTLDANQVCSDSSECQGLCLANLSSDERDRMVRTKIPMITQGKCASWLVTVGCIAIVEQGQVKNILCID